jgi:hypothetical protein
MNRLERTDEPKWLDPKKGGNLWSLPDIFQTTRLLFYLHAAYPEAVPPRDISIHLGWDSNERRYAIIALKRYAYIEVVNFPRKRVYYKGSKRYRITRRGWEAVQDLLKEATRPQSLR